MDPSTKKTAISAALVMASLCFIAFILPSIVLWLGNISPYLGGAAAFLFVVGFFGIFWLRGRRRRD